MESNPLPSPELATISSPLEQQVGVLVAGLLTDGILSETLESFDRATDGWLTDRINQGHVRGKRGELALLPSPISSGPPMLLLVGLGDGSVDRNEALEISATAIRRLAYRPQKQVVCALAESCDESVHDALVAGAIYACEEQSLYQSEPSFHTPDAIKFSGLTDEVIDRGQVIGMSVNHTRRLVNEPPAVIYPQSFVERTVGILDGTDVSIEVWDEDQLVAEGCRAILAVGGGSAKPPRLMMMRYNGGGDEQPLAIVGKGVTFDSGGLSLKPSESMVDMKCDMAGAATVVGVMHAIAKLGLKKNVIGLCGLAENMVSGSSYKLGDVIETRSGKTIEILNTDAEGRVVLADTLDVAIQNEPRAMVDLATLTGACMVALGTDVVGSMANDQSLCDEIHEAAAAEGELVWQLPMFKLYDDKVKSKVADIKNVGEGKWGGAITAAKFLENFVGDTPWVHLDIAGPAFADGGKSFRDAGATGVMVRSLIRWIEES